MNLSGILVTADPAAMAAVLQSLSALPGIEIRDTNPASGRIVVVQEAVDVADEMSSFARMRGLPGVVDVALVCHYFGDEPADGAAPAAAA